MEQLLALRSTVAGDAPADALICLNWSSMKLELDYSNAVNLDAEDLAEQGIAKAYQAVLAALSPYVAHPAVVKEIIDDEALSYVVRCADSEYVICSPALPDDQGQSWGRATHTLFKIINDQLSESDYKLYAINGGNDLMGLLLTDSECEAARRSLGHKEDWPYIPTLEHPWYGQNHA